MTEPKFPAAGSDMAGRPSTPRRPPVNWALVLGLGALALLWPLLQVTGVRDRLGGAATAGLVFGIVAMVWIGGVGLFRMPQPVLTLTLAGVVSGVVIVIFSVVFGPGVGAHTAPVALFVIGPSAALGAVAGVLAAAVQRLRRRR